MVELNYPIIDILLLFWLHPLWIWMWRLANSSLDCNNQTCNQLKVPILLISIVLVIILRCIFQIISQLDSFIEVQGLGLELYPPSPSTIFSLYWHNFTQLGFLGWYPLICFLKPWPYSRDSLFEVNGWFAHLSTGLASRPRVFTPSIIGFLALLVWLTFVGLLRKELWRHLG